MWFIGKLSRDKRGAGSIIGAVFIVLILLSGFTFYTLNVNTTEHYNKALGSMSALDWNRNREKIVIKEVKITGTNKLNVTVENEGPVLSHIILLGIFNKTDNTQRYETEDKYFEPSETENIVSDFTVIEGKKYVIQLVTELGNTIKHKFYPASEVNCKLTLITAPATAYKGNNVTVLFIVTHNDTEVDTIQNLTASLEAEPTDLVEVEEEPSSLSVKALTRGESAFFRWIYNTADIGTVTFNATYEQAPTGTYALSTVEIISPPGDGGPGGVGEITITGNNTISYNEDEEYRLRITDANGDPVTDPLLLTICFNVSDVNINEGSIPKIWTIKSDIDGWCGVVELDASGEFTFKFKSTKKEGQSLTLFVQVGGLVGKKEIVQEPKP